MSRTRAVAYIALGLGFLVVAVIAAARAPGPDARDRNTINGTWPYRLHEALER